MLCVEVVEHLDESAADALLSSLEAHSEGLILFSGADEKQPGKGHRNCRPARYWIDKWDGLGWEPDVLASLAFRSLSTFSWLRRNPMILRRAGSGARGDAGEILARIGESEYRWYGQTAEIHEYPFLEDPPDDLVD